MTTWWRCALLAGCMLAAGCASAPPPPAGDAETTVVWGDEYDGVLIDTDLIDEDFNNAHRSLAADVSLTAESRTLRATAAAGPASARYRESASGRAGAASFDSRHLSAVAGAVRASLGEGAVLADARDAASVEPRGARTFDGLRMTPSSSTWGSALGAGVRLSLSRVRVAAGAWQDRDDPGDARAFVSVLAARGPAMVMAAAGQSRTGARVLSLGAARATTDAFLSGEAGVAPDGARVVTRAVAGVDGAWRVLLAAGTPLPSSDPSPASPGARWGGALERRGRWRGVSSKVTLSTRTRRDDATLERRQRLEWASGWRLPPASLEVGVRATRATESAAAGVLVPASATHIDDELRVRAALHAAETLAGGRLRADQSYRVEFVMAGAGPAGRVLAWTGRLRWRGADARVQASAFDLPSGQLAYAGRAALPGAATFTTLSRSGVDLSASLQVDAAGRVRLGAQGVWTAAGESRWALQAGMSL